MKDRIHQHIQQAAGQEIPHEENKLHPLEGLAPIRYDKTSEWHEEDHPRGAQTGKFVAKVDQHEVKVYDKKGKLLIPSSGAISAERFTTISPNKPETTACPTCGEHPRRHGGARSTN